LCFTYGFARDFFEDFNYEAMYGLSLNMKRCQSIWGAQFFKVKFGLDKLGFHLDDGIMDAMSPDEDHKVVVRDEFMIAYRNFLLSRIDNNGGGSG